MAWTTPRTWVTDELVTASLLNVHIRDNMTFLYNKTDENAIPSGALMPYAGSSAPNGWLLCDGSAVSRTTYAALFSAIGTSFGNGDGSTTFNVPDMRGRVPAGIDNMGGSSANRVTDSAADSVGGDFGSETHTLTESEIPEHNHSIDRRSGGGSGTSKADGGPGAYHSSLHSDDFGGDGAHNNVQPTLFVLYIIKT